MRADRLLSILLLLQSHGRLPARALAERLEVSERTVHRDMESLAMAGVPVYAERGRHGGWALTEPYRTDLTGLTEFELRSVVLASAPAISRVLASARAPCSSCSPRSPRLAGVRLRRRAATCTSIRPAGVAPRRQPRTR